MSLITAVIMPVKIFIYIATQISSTVINILKEEYGYYTSRYCGI